MERQWQQTCVTKIMSRSSSRSSRIFVRISGGRRFVGVQNVHRLSGPGQMNACNRKEII